MSEGGIKDKAINTIHLGHSSLSWESGGLRRRFVRLFLGVVLGLSVLFVTLFLLSASGSRTRAGFAPAVASDVAGQAAAARRWLSETVDNSGYDASLVLEPVAPYTLHISYFDHANGALKHAWWTSSGWLSETVGNSGDVGFISLALEPIAPYTPHISYQDFGNSALKHAWWTSSGWLSETVDNSGYVGGWASLVLEPVAPYTPHVSYLDVTNSALKYAWWTSAGWLSETVDNSGEVGVGGGTSLALEPVVPYTLHISYLDFTNGALKHAWWTSSGWLSETVDNSGHVGVHISLALKPVAPYAPHVSYVDYTNDVLKHAWWTPSGWLSETVDGSAWVNGVGSLALEPVAPYTPHISYVDSPNRAIKHAWLTTGRDFVFLPLTLRDELWH